MATHSSILAWRVPWTEEPGGPQSMGVTQSGTPLKRFSTAQHIPEIWPVIWGFSHTDDN